MGSTESLTDLREFLIVFRGLKVAPMFFFFKIFASLSVVLMKNKCTPLCKHAAKWRHYILGKETVIHTDHKPLQFMQTQVKLHNDRHQKWSTYLQQFHLNIKYKTGSTNRVADCLSRLSVATLTTMLDYCSHETSRWPQLYETDHDFATTYQMLGANEFFDNFHLQDGLLCHLGHICVPSSERVKMIWESHYVNIMVAAGGIYLHV
jgi:hypothetical protein